MGKRVNAFETSQIFLSHASRSSKFKNEGGLVYYNQKKVQVTAQKMKMEGRHANVFMRLRALCLLTSK